jgi:membrane associated rhomboid family serine protease
MRALRSYEMPPPATACFIAVCLVCGVVQLSMDPAATRRFTLSGNAVFVDGQWYRVITSAFLHGGALHLGMNALSTAAIGAALERRTGSAFLFCYAAWAAPLSGFVAAALAFGWTLVTGDPVHAAQHGLGFSGVIFALAASEAWRPPVPKPNLQPDFNMSVFECFDTSSSAGLRELDESNRSVQKSAESTSI